MTDQPPVVLLHGVGLDHTMWQPFTKALTSLGDHQVLAPDLPGHGDQPPLTGPATLAGLTDQLADRLPRRCHLVGFSLGALLAQQLAWSAPARVATLTLVSAVYKRTPQQAAAVAGRLAAARADFPASAAASLTRWFPPGTDPAVLAATRTTLLANNVASYLAAYQVFATADAQLASRVHQITAPTLVVTGGDDPGSTPDMAQALGAAIPGAHTVIVPGARHMLPVQRPGELAGLIHDLICRTPEPITTESRAHHD